VLHQEGVERDPVPLGYDLSKPFLRLLRGPGAHDAEPVRDPVDVGVDRDCRDPVAEHQDAVRRLRSDVREAEQLLHRPGNDPVEPVEDLARAVANRARLRPVEAGLPDERLDRSRFGGRQTHGIGISREQPGARDVRRLVPSSLRKDRPDQYLEGVLRVVPEVRNAPVAPLVERRETVHEGLPIEGGGRSHPALPGGGDASDAPG
jgi:hypothetical protein